MTYAEARGIIRKHYDMWSAAAKLHEVLEKASEAETFLARSDAEIAGRSKRITDLDAQGEAATVLYNSNLAQMKEELTKVGEDLSFAKANMKAQTEALETSYQEQSTAWAKSLSDLTVAHDVRMKELGKEAEAAQIKLRKLQDEFAAAKKQITDLFLK